MHRREFIQKSCVACLSFTVLSSILESCTTTKSATGKLNQDGLIIDKSEFEITQKGGTGYASFLVIRNEKLKYPICVFRMSENNYSALWMQCSHQGAELQVAGDVLQCPAHGSEFNNRGEVSNGPASQNLRRFPVTVSQKEIFIDLRKA